jgi:hypothetical protein
VIHSATAPRSSTTRNWTDEQRQAFRLHRYRLAAGTSLMVIVLLYAAYVDGGLDRTGLVQGTLLILFWDVVFYLILRTRLNLKLRDQSLTSPQVVASIGTMAYIMYHADGGRGALLLVYLVSFLFAVFRLRTPQLLRLAIVVVAAYAVMLAALYRYKPETVQLSDEVLQLIVLAITTPWFAWMGG